MFSTDRTVGFGVAITAAAMLRPNACVGSLAAGHTIAKNIELAYFDNRGPAGDVSTRGFNQRG